MVISSWFPTSRKANKSTLNIGLPFSSIGNRWIFCVLNLETSFWSVYDICWAFLHFPQKRLRIQIVNKMNKAPMADSQQIHALLHHGGDTSQPNTLVFFWFLSDEDSWKNYTSGNVFEHFSSFSSSNPWTKIQGYSWALYLSLISGATLASRRVGHPKWSSQIETKQNVEVTGFAVWIRRFTPKIWHLQPETFEKILLITGKTAWT